MSYESLHTKWVLLWLTETPLPWNFIILSGEFWTLENLITILDVLYASVKTHDGA